MNFKNTIPNLLKIVNKKLIVIDPHSPHKVKLKKSIKGQMVVKGHAALALGIDEEYLEIEFYDQTNN